MVAHLLKSSGQYLTVQRPPTKRSSTKPAASKEKDRSNNGLFSFVRNSDSAKFLGGRQVVGAFYLGNQALDEAVAGLEDGVFPQVVAQADHILAELEKDDRPSHLVAAEKDAA
jgi:hypothetical protein